VTRGLVAVVAGLAIAGGGCAVQIASWSAATPPGVAAAREPLPSHGHFTGRSCRWWLLGVPFGLPTVEEAMGDALAQGHGSAMRDLTLTSAHPTYGPVGRNCYVVKGEVVG
jgi:hypothetical protein